MSSSRVRTAILEQNHTVDLENYIWTDASCKIEIFETIFKGANQSFRLGASGAALLLGAGFSSTKIIKIIVAGSDHVMEIETTGVLRNGQSHFEFNTGDTALIVVAVGAQIGNIMRFQRKGDTVSVWADQGNGPPVTPLHTGVINQLLGPRSLDYK